MNGDKEESPPSYTISSSLLKDLISAIVNRSPYVWWDDSLVRELLHKITKETSVRFDSVPGTAFLTIKEPRVEKDAEKAIDD